MPDEIKIKNCNLGTHAHVEMKNETSKIDESYDEFITDNIEVDIVVKIPPLKKQSVVVKVKSIEKATPNIVEPEEF